MKLLICTETTQSLHFSNFKMITRGDHFTEYRQISNGTWLLIKKMLDGNKMYFHVSKEQFHNCFQHPIIRTTNDTGELKKTSLLGVNDAGRFFLLYTCLKSQ